MNTTGNTVLMIGGTSGIGLDLACRFRDAGNSVVIAGRPQDKPENIAGENPPMRWMHCDVTDQASVDAAAAKVTNEFTDVNVVVVMAGFMIEENLLDPEHIRTAETVVAVNLLGTIRVLAALTPRLASLPEATIITVSSGLGFVPMPSTPTYSATKAGVHSFTVSLRTQLAGTPVQVIELIPPAVRTTLLGQQDDEAAMPMDEFLDEAWQILHDDPSVREVVVDRARMFRNAEAEGRYDAVLAAVTSPSR